MGGPLQARILVEIGTAITHIHLGEFLTLTSHRLNEGEHGAKVESITSNWDGSSSSIIILCPLPMALKLEKLYQKESKYFNHGTPTTISITCLGLCRKNASGHSQQSLRQPMAKATSSSDSRVSHSTAAGAKISSPAESSSSSSSSSIRSMDDKREMGKVLDILGDSILDVFKEYRSATKRVAEGHAKRKPSNDLISKRKSSTSTIRQNAPSKSREPSCCQECGKIIADETSPRSARGEEKPSPSYYADTKSSSIGRSAYLVSKDEVKCVSSLRRGSSASAKQSAEVYGGRDNATNLSSLTGSKPSASEDKGSLPSSPAPSYCSCPPSRKTTTESETWDELAFDMGRRLMQPTRLCFANLSSIVEGTLALQRLQRSALLLFNIQPTWHSLAIALVHLQKTGQVNLTLRAAYNLRQVAMPSKARVRVADTTKSVRATRLWGSLVSRVLSAQERSTILFSHFCGACVVLLQDFLVTSSNKGLPPSAPSKPTSSKRRLSDDIRDMLSLYDEDKAEGDEQGTRKPASATSLSTLSKAKISREKEHEHVLGSATVLMEANVVTSSIDEKMKVALVESFQRHKVCGDGAGAKIKLRGLATVLKDANLDVNPTAVSDWVIKRKELKAKEDGAAMNGGMVPSSSTWLLTQADLYAYLEAHYVAAPRAKSAKGKSQAKQEPVTVADMGSKSKECETIVVPAPPAVDVMVAPQIPQTTSSQKHVKDPSSSTNHPADGHMVIEFQQEELSGTAIETDTINLYNHCIEGITNTLSQTQGETSAEPVLMENKEPTEVEETSASQLILECQKGAIPERRVHDDNNCSAESKRG